ncbi:unnamed protein product, partial [Prorocentrum cordatum]
DLVGPTRVPRTRVLRLPDCGLSLPKRPRRGPVLPRPGGDRGGRGARAAAAAPRLRDAAVAPAGRGPRARAAAAARGRGGRPRAARGARPGRGAAGAPRAHAGRRLGVRGVPRLAASRLPHDAAARRAAALGPVGPGRRRGRRARALPRHGRGAAGEGRERARGAERRGQDARPDRAAGPRGPPLAPGAARLRRHAAVGRGGGAVAGTRRRRGPHGAGAARGCLQPLGFVPERGTGAALRARPLLHGAGPPPDRRGRRTLAELRALLERRAALQRRLRVLPQSERLRAGLQEATSGPSPRPPRAARPGRALRAAVGGALPGGRTPGRLGAAAGRRRARRRG